jgi:hypothetical protein
MEPIVGIFSSRSAAEQAGARLRERGFPAERISMLLPGGPVTPRSIEAAVPTEEAEQSGVGQAIGGVVGGAAGASAGVLAASLLVPGVGAVTAIGLAAALFGALGGVKAGSALEKTRHGIPKDELYLYEDALAHGKGVVFVLPETEDEAASARRTLAEAGAETLEAAREAWWVGIRDAEKAHYDSLEGDFDTDEEVYREGLIAALLPQMRGKSYDEALPLLRELYGDAVEHKAFREGYARGAVKARRRESELEPAGKV